MSWWKPFLYFTQTDAIDGEEMQIQPITAEIYTGTSA